MAIEELFKVSFFNHDTVYEVYARQVAQSNLLGFIEIEELVFGDKTSVVVDPSQEKLKTEFNDVKRSYIPIHNVLRIDEVSKEGTAKITELKNQQSNVRQFPKSIYSSPDLTSDE